MLPELSSNSIAFRPFVLMAGVSPFHIFSVGGRAWLDDTTPGRQRRVTVWFFLIFSLSGGCG